jgi:MFS family permease
MDDLLEANYPSRRWVAPLAGTVMVGFGVILYGFSVYATDQAAGAEFSKTTLSLAYGGAIFVGGLLALPVGHFADRHGVRIVIGAGALLGGLGLVGFSISNHPWLEIGAWWLFVGPALAFI